MKSKIIKIFFLDHLNLQTMVNQLHQVTTVCEKNTQGPNYLIIWFIKQVPFKIQNQDYIT